MDGYELQNEELITTDTIINRQFGNENAKSDLDAMRFAAAVHCATLLKLKEPKGTQKGAKGLSLRSTLEGCQLEPY